MRRFAIWTAVSTVEQADDDKASLKEQEKVCRSVGEGKGWKESAGPFVVPGKSRTRWVNLRDAELEIPALHEMLDNAKRRRFDILILYDYNRLRNLLDPVAETLASYGIQIYSVNQPVEPADDDFDIYLSDGESMMRGMAQIISRWQIADLRRKFRYGVSARVHRGLHSTKIPWGYVKQQGSDVPVIVPSQAAVIIEIKEMFLRGVPMRRMISILNNKYPTPTHSKNGWSRPSIARILENPYYAGKVFFGLTKTIRDPHHNTTRTVKNPNPTIADGKHKALYSWEDYQAILAEFQRRASLPHSSKYPYSGLLKCSVCGNRLYHWNELNVWRCAYPRGGKGTDHIALKEDEADRIIPPAVLDAVKNVNLHKTTYSPRPSSNVDDREILADLERQRKRIQDGFEAGIYDISQAQGKIADIEKQITSIKDKELQKERQASEQRKYREVLEEVARKTDKFPSWILRDDPKKVNDLLLKLCQEIVISPDRQVDVKLRPF